ncbi:MAG: bifunctional pyr operon transcriptional regulator/uracil phosphoribosyltransferase PyrR [Verrucomicrobiales bacterium]|nr:bifunctional pyr operon transcriptional regulator/uracil phosphoribosyltransferase PyrR [Verrucomicrobiales bacterium]
MSARRILMTADGLRLAISRMAHEIAERDAGAERLLIVGVQAGGIHLAARLAQELQQWRGQPLIAGQLDVSMHRDDLSQRPAPAIRPTNLPGDVQGATVVLVDDVLFSGRTVRAALDALHDFGRPERVRLAVLVDRLGHRQVPIQADYVARKVESLPGQRVEVMWSEDGSEDGVFLNQP